MIFMDFGPKKHLGRIFSMQNISNPPAAGTLTPAREGAPCSASHENRSIPVISPPQGENTPGPREEGSPAKP